jgi:hypothetical protein
MNQPTLFHLGVTDREQVDLNAKRIVSVVLPMTALKDAENGSLVSYGDQKWTAEIWNMDKPYRFRNEFVRLVKFKRVFGVYCKDCGEDLPSKLYSYCDPCGKMKVGT